MQDNSLTSIIFELERYHNNTSSENTDFIDSMSCDSDEDNENILLVNTTVPKFSQFGDYICATLNSLDFDNFHRLLSDNVDDYYNMKFGIFFYRRKASINRVGLHDVGKTFHGIIYSTPDAVFRVNHSTEKHFSDHITYYSTFSTDGTTVFPEYMEQCFRELRLHPIRKGSINEEISPVSIMFNRCKTLDFQYKLKGRIIWKVNLLTNKLTQVFIVNENIKIKKLSNAS